MNYNEVIPYEAIPDAELRDAVLAELRWHREQDNLVRGQYWEEGKGCAVGCLLKSDDHAEYPRKFGIPVMLARLEDGFFEGLGPHEAMEWPSRFMGAALSAGNTRQERMDILTRVQWRWLHWLVAEELTQHVVGEGKVHDNVRAAIERVAHVIEPATRGEAIDRDATRAAHAARADAAAARADAASDADAAAAAASDAAADAASDAAYHAACATTAACHAAACHAARAARADAAAAHAAFDAATAYRATRAAYSRMADKLIELIEANGEVND